MTEEVKEVESQAPEAPEKPKAEPKRKAPAKPTLDLSKDYGEVRGLGVRARYHQDGEYFGGDGTHLGKKLV